MLVVVAEAETAVETKPKRRGAHLTPEHQRRARQALAEKYGSAQLSEWGRKGGRAGYAAVTQRMGKDVFHRAGGNATASLDLCTNKRIGEVGLSAAMRVKGWQPRKKHRYGCQQ